MSKWSTVGTICMYCRLEMDEVSWIEQLPRLKNNTMYSTSV